MSTQRILLFRIPDERVMLVGDHLTRIIRSSVMILDGVLVGRPSAEEFRRLKDLFIVGNIYLCVGGFMIV